MPKVGPCDGCLMVVTTFFPKQFPRAWQTPIVVVDLPSPSGVGLIPDTTTKDPSGASCSRAATARTSTLALWRPQGMTSSLLSPALRATRSIGKGVQACEMTMSLGTGCKRFTCVEVGDAGLGDCDLFARNVSFRDNCSDDDTLVSGLEVRATAASANLSVFFSKEAMVMGPTPPGTGVIFDATRDALSKSTSPTKRLPDFLLLSGMKFVPTSTTTHPGFNQLPLTNWA
mmetsp:Transcript_14284/g.37874  ORF Transcript_14284/g.37874 Transcript_14284/m.37874 type:complete len:229 (-) Transcript_14284:916-1602(-)